MLAVSFDVNVNLLLYEILLRWYDSRKAMLLVSLVELDLALDVCLLNFGSLYVAIRGREDAKGDRNAGIEIQIAGSLARRELFSCSFRRYRKVDKKGPLASLVEEGE